AENPGHDRLANFEHLAIVLGADCRRPRLARKQRKFAETIALAHSTHSHAGAVARDGDRGRSAQHHEHRIAWIAFLDQAFAPAVAMNFRVLKYALQLLVVHAIEERF